MEPYADVIIDLSVKNVDRIFQYRIPDHLKELVKPGVQVNIPFGKGNTERKGIVVGLSKETDYDPEKMKELLDVETGAVPIRTQMICLAFWMKDRYSTTMNQALKTVLPVKAKVMPREERVIVSLKPKNEIKTLLIEAEKKKYRARIRLYRALLENGELPLKLTSEKLGITAAMLKPLVEKEIVDLKTVKKEPGAGNRFPETGPVALNQEQKNAAETVIRDYDSGQRNTYLLYGITGSGKTEVYMELIDYVDSINMRHGATDQVFSTETPAAQALEKKALEYDLHLLQARCKHLGTENNLKILQSIYEEVRQGVEFRFRTAVTKIENLGKEGYRLITDKGDEVDCTWLIAGPGRSGAEWFSNQCHLRGPQRQQVDGGGLHGAEDPHQLQPCGYRRAGGAARQGVRAHHRRGVRVQAGLPYQAVRRPGAHLLHESQGCGGQ